MISRPSGNLNYIATCVTCHKESEPLSNNVQVAIYRLMDEYDWIVYDDFTTAFCSERCLDDYEIDNIDEIVDNAE